MTHHTPVTETLVPIQAIGTLVVTTMTEIELALQLVLLLASVVWTVVKTVLSIKEYYETKGLDDDDPS